MKLEKNDFQRSEIQSALTLFYQGIRAQETRRRYTGTLQIVLCEILEDILEGTFEDRANQLVSLCKKDSDWAVDLMLNVSRKLAERTSLEPNDVNYLNPSTFPNYFKPIRKLLDMNGVGMPWKRIQITYPEINNISNTREWKKDEIRTMLEYANGVLVRSIILMLASSGMRIGGMNLCWGDITPIYESIDGQQLNFTEGRIVCAAVDVYKSSPERYTTFITPEAYDSLQKYRQEWIVDTGKAPAPTDPLFKQPGKLVKRLDSLLIRRRLAKLVVISGLQKKIVGQRANEVPVCNGFRRFWNKTCKESSTGDPLSSLVRKEMMMGHIGLIKLDQNYFKTHVLEMAKDYVKCVGDLTINDRGVVGNSDGDCVSVDQGKSVDLSSSFTSTKNTTDQRIDEMMNIINKLLLKQGDIAIT